jgi:hypothetical protein
MIYYVTENDPLIIVYSLATMVPGLIIYFAISKKPVGSTGNIVVIN